MKKIKVNTVVYDRTTMEYVQKSVSHTISDELAEMIQKELYEASMTAYEATGHGCGKDGQGRIPGLRTPLCSQKRFFIEPRFMVVDENDNQICGWRGF